MEFRNRESAPLPNREFSSASALTLYHLGPPMASWMICSSLSFGIWSSRFRVKGQRIWLGLFGGGVKLGMGSLIILGLLDSVNPFTIPIQEGCNVPFGVLDRQIRLFHPTQTCPASDGIGKS
jgi:hypothetical protein